MFLLVFLLFAILLQCFKQDNIKQSFLTELPWLTHTIPNLVYWDLWEDDLRSAELRLTSVELLYKPYYKHSQSKMI